jgi:hypothetical protein
MIVAPGQPTSGLTRFPDGRTQCAESVANFAYSGFGTSGKEPFLAYSRHAAPAPQAAMPWVVARTLPA